MGERNEGGYKPEDSCRSRFVKLVAFTGVVVAALVGLLRRR